MLNSKRDFLKDIERIRSLSSVIDKKLSENMLKYSHKGYGS